MTGHVCWAGYLKDLTTVEAVLTVSQLLREADKIWRDVVQSFANDAGEISATVSEFRDRIDLWVDIYAKANDTDAGDLKFVRQTLHEKVDYMCYQGGAKA